FEQRSAESHWDNIISAAVDEKDRGLNSRDLPARIEAPDEQWTDHRQDGPRHVAGRGKGRLQDDPCTLVPGREVNSYCGAQRLAVHDDLLGPTGLQKVLIRRLSVSIEPILRRSAGAFAVAAIVNHQNRGAGSGNLTEALTAMRDVACVAVQEEGDAAAPGTGDKPAMDTDTIRRVEPDVGCSELGLQAPKPFRVPDWKIDGTNRHEMHRQRSEGDEKRPGDIPGDARHEITVAFRENPGTHGAGSHSSLAATLAESSTSRIAVLRQFDTTRRITVAKATSRSQSGPTSCLRTSRELSGRLHFLSVGRYAVKVRPLLVDNIRFRLVNKPGCQHEKIGACVPLTNIIGV